VEVACGSSVEGVGHGVIIRMEAFTWMGKRKWPSLFHRTMRSPRSPPGQSSGPSVVLVSPHQSERFCVGISGLVAV
jgi:hypothetical protein